jgi:hypothetical protein
VGLQLPVRGAVAVWLFCCLMLCVVLPCVQLLLLQLYKQRGSAVVFF